MSWSTVPAAELMLKRGGSVNPRVYPDEVFELLSIPAYDKNEPEILTGAEIGSSKSCVEPGDVLLSKIVPHIRRCWIVPKKGVHRQIGSGEWIIFRDNRFDAGFLRHFLMSDIFHRQFMNTVAGVGGSLVRARPSGVERIEIPLPPLPEQKRIAAILDKADAIRRKRQQAIKLADEFLRSVFLDMFGDLSKLKMTKIQEIASSKKYALSSGPFGSSLTSSHYVDDGVIVLRGTNVSSGELNLENVKYVSEEKAKELRRSAIYPGDVVIVAVGASGRALRIPDEIPQAIMSQNFNKITPNTEMVAPTYLEFCFNSKFVQDQFSRNTTDTVRTFLSLTKIKEICIPVPPISKQSEFQTVVESVRGCLSKMNFNDQLSGDLFSSLSHKAFLGEL